MIKSVNGKVIELTAVEETAVLAVRASYNPLPDLRHKLLLIERVNIIENLLQAKKTQINSMNETALRAAISAGGLD